MAREKRANAGNLMLTQEAYASEFNAREPCTLRSELTSLLQSGLVPSRLVLR